MERIQHYRPPKNHRKSSYWQAFYAMMTQESKRTILLFLSLWIGGGAMLLGLTGWVTFSGKVADPTDDICNLLFIWFLGGPWIVGYLTTSPFLIAKQLQMPDVAKTLFRLNVFGSIFLGLIPLGFFFACLGWHALLPLAFYLFVMGLMPGKLAKMSYVFYLVWWIALAWWLFIPSFFPSIQPAWKKLVLPMPFLVMFLLAGVGYWAVAWWKVFHGWTLEREDLDEIHRTGTEDSWKQERYAKSGRVGTWWEDRAYRRIASRCAGRFWDRIRLGVLGYGNPGMWFSNVLLVLFLFGYIFFIANEFDYRSIKIGVSEIYWFFLLVNLLPLVSMPNCMTRWRDSLALHRFFPVSNRTAIREAAIIFAVTMLQTWLVCVLVLLGSVYFLCDNGSVFTEIPSILLFSVAYLTLQYGCAILFMVVRGKDFYPVLNVFSLFSLAILFGLWYLIGWPLSVVLLLVGMYVSFGAYRRLHTIEPELIGKSD